MRRHVVRMGRCRSDLGIHTSSIKSLFRKNGIVIAMNDVVGSSWMPRLAGENRFKDFPAFFLVREGLISLWSGDGQCQCVEDRRFVVLRVGSLQGRHLLFKSLAMSICILPVFPVNLGESINVCSLTRCHVRIARSNLLCSVE